MTETRSSSEEILPLTPVQRAYLVRARRGEFRGITETGSVRTGLLDLELFGRAWREVQAAVPLLRTSFAWEEGVEPEQRVHREEGGELEVEDWSSLSLTEQRSKVESWLTDHAVGLFGWGKFPLVRLTAVRVTGGFQVLWSYHALVLDRPSAMRMWAALWQVYRALSAEQEVPTMDHAGLGSHLNWIGQRFSNGESPFWAKSLKGVPPATGMPVGREGAVVELHGDILEREIAINPAMAADLKEKAGQHSLGVGIILAGAWAVVLSRHLGSRDVVMGISVSGQPEAASGARELQVGPFVHDIPVRVEVSPDDRLAPMLVRLQAWRRSARPHEYLPVEAIMECAGSQEGESFSRRG